MAVNLFLSYHLQLNDLQRIYFPALVILFLFLQTDSQGSDINFRKHPNSLEADSLSRSTAREYENKGMFSMSREILIKSLTELSKNGQSNSTEFARLLFELGELYLDKKEYAIASDFFSEAEDIMDKTGQARQNQLYIQLKLKQAFTEVKLDNHLSAIVNSNQIRTIFEDSLGINHPATLGIVLQIAEIYTEIESYSKAGNLYDEVEGIILQYPDEKDSTQMDLLLEKAKYLDASGNIAAAVNTQKAAIQQVESLIGSENGVVAIARVYLAELLIRSGDGDQAKLILEKPELEKILGKHHPVNQQRKTLLSAYYWSLGNYLESEKILSEVIGDHFSFYERFYPVLGVQEKAAHYNAVDELVEKYANLLEAQGSMGGQGNGTLLSFVMILNQLPLYSKDWSAEIGKDYIEWRDLLEQLLHLYQIPFIDVDGGSKTIKKLEDELASLEKSVQKQSRTFTDRKISKADYSEVVRILADGQCAMEILRFRSFDPDLGGVFTDEVHYGFLWFDNNSSKQPKWFVIKNGNDLENKFLTHYRSSINHRFPDDYSYTMYYEPLKEILVNYSSIIVAPAGAYRQINLATLRNPETGGYLIDEKQIRLVSGIQEILGAERAKIESEHKVFIFGNPVFNLVSDTPGNNELNPMPQFEFLTSRESESGMNYMRSKTKQHIQWNELLYQDEVKKHETGLLEDLYESSGFKTKSFIGDEALEVKLKQLDKPYSLHLALHGYFMEDEGYNSGIYQDNQLLHSGLMFSGSFDFLDGKTVAADMSDGLLTAYEIYNLDLSETELVFLSSCETGLGIVQNGRSIYHFQNAFKSAGARSVIMSMWTTEAEYQLEFMNLFYYYWLFEKSTKREAFTKARNIMKETYERSYYWGAFIFIGE